ncbi:MAG: hypothetical protein ACK57Y_09265, partial [Pirellulaceae bacterium]
MNTIDYASRGGAVTVDLELLSSDGLSSFKNINRFVGSSSADFLVGPEARLDQTSWRITGLNAGSVDGSLFEGFENLRGQDGSNDAFIFEVAGSLSGSIDGGLGGLDGFAVAGSGGTLLAYQPTAADSQGIQTLGGKSVNFAGVDPYSPWSGNGLHQVFQGSIFDRSVTLKDANIGSSGQMMLSFDRLTFSSGDSSYLFSNPAEGLTIITGTGGDQLVVDSIDAGFQGALLQYAGGVLRADLRAIDDDLTLGFLGASFDEGLLLSLQLNGFSQSFGREGAGVREIQIQGGSGDDRIEIQDKLQIAISIAGGLGNDLLLGPVSGTEWELTGPGKGSAVDVGTFDGIENITGGDGDDQFVVRTISGVTGSLSGQLHGGLGADELVGGDGANEWQVNGTNSGSLNGLLVFTSIASLTGGSSTDRFVIRPSGSVTGVIDGGLDLAQTPGGDPAIDSIDYSLYGSEVEVNLSAESATGITGFDRIDLFVGSNSAVWDTLRGAGEAEETTEWVIDGPDSGKVREYRFRGFENLTGRDGTQDSFLFEVGGSLRGVVAGGVLAGDDIKDGFAVNDGTNKQVYSPALPEASGTVTIDGRVVQFSGMDPVEVLEGTSVERVLKGTIFSDTMVIEDVGSDNDGMMRLSVPCLKIIDELLGILQVFSFAVPSTSLKIEGGLGADKISIKRLDRTFAADLLVYGNSSEVQVFEPDPSKDEVVFEGSVYTRGGYLEVFSDTIRVNDGVTLSTVVDNDLDASNDIVFRARRVGTVEFENLLPSGYLSKSVEIEIGKNATLLGSSVYLVASAEDRALQDNLGLTTLESQMFVDPYVSKLQDLVALPVKVLLKASEAKVTIGANTKILAGNSVGIYSTTAADASSQAKSELFSIGYAQSSATSLIDVQSGVKIQGAGSINITSDATSVAGMSTETEREEQGNVPGKKSSQFAASVAAAWAKLTSKTTIAATAEIQGGRTVNIRALGNIEAEASSESSLFADGSAALSIGLQFSTADILAEVAGKVTAEMNTNGGEVVKFEFDPTVKGSDYTTDQTARRLIPGETVKTKFVVPPAVAGDPQMPAGTVFKYIGPRVNSAVALALQNYADKTLWEVTSEPWGFVDTDQDRIAVYNLDNEASNWVVVSEDTVDYSPRRGESIGGLSPGTYTIVALPDNPATAVDESRYVKLARNDTLAIDAYAWEEAGNTGRNPYVVDLTGGAITSKRTFDASDVVDDQIAFQRSGDDKNAIELGQAVIYREPGRTDSDKVVEDEDGNLRWQSQNTSIDGQLYVPLMGGGSPDWKETGAYLEHGGLYYVLAAVDQFSLIGDSRFIDKQVIRLGALENETRGGIGRIKIGKPLDARAKDFSLSATHILDSTFLTFGIVSSLNTSDTASASAGLAKEEVDDESPDDTKGFDFDKSIFDNLFSKGVEQYQKNKNAGGANGKSALQVGGGLAFIYTDHDVKTTIKGTADLNSNDDMELTSAITQAFSVSAEGTGEAQPGKKDKQGAAAPNTSADSSVATGISVVVMNNQSQAIIENGATLDSMRALRLLSGVTYPLLNRPDEFFPTSWSGFFDKLETEGFDYVNNYLDGTGGLKSLFNSWTRSTTSADKLAIAGSITVLALNNVSESIVHTGAKINQDDFYRPDPRFYLQPGDPGYDPDYDPAVDNDNETHSRNANNVDEHVVSIEAINYIQLMTVTGVFNFKLPSAELSSPFSLFGNGIDDVEPSFELSATPNRGGKGGVGGALFLQFIDNKTHAIVEDGVKLYSGKQSGLNIKAEEAILSFSFGQAGASAGKFAVGGTISYVEQDSDTLAHLDAGSEIRGGRVDVYAGNLNTQITWAGGVAASKAIGAGIAVAINNIDRKTQAVIGELSDTSGTGIQGKIDIDVDGAVTARSNVGGSIYAFTVAGAFANASNSTDSVDGKAGGNGPKTKANSKDNASGDDSSSGGSVDGDLDDGSALDGVSLPRLFAEEEPTPAAEQKMAGTSVSIAAAVALNNISDVTQASISDAIVIADAVDVRSLNRNSIVAATGGLAFSKTDSGGNAGSLAGALSYNGVENSTLAFIRDAQLTLRSTEFESFVVESTDTRVSVLADNQAKIWTLAAGGGGAVAGGGASSGSSFAGSLAGSVSLNTIAGPTRAKLIETTVTLQSGSHVSDVVVLAKDRSEIFAIAGSLSLSLAKSGSSSSLAISAGVAIAVNRIATDIDSLVELSQVEWDTNAIGKFLVRAESLGSIEAYTVAGALAGASGSSQGSGVGAAGARSG